jgi:hypothetical protein
MLCPACKTETGSDSQFCPHCGANTTTGVAAALPAHQGGLSETAAGVVAYITIIPALIFLVMEPYNRSSFIRFHAWQSIFFGITVAVVHFVLGVIPILGWILLGPGGHCISDSVDLCDDQGEQGRALQDSVYRKLRGAGGKVAG